jgi:hypothetical protein
MLHPESQACIRLQTQSYFDEIETIDRISKVFQGSVVGVTVGILNGNAAGSHNIKSHNEYSVDFTGSSGRVRLVFRDWAAISPVAVDTLYTRLSISADTNRLRPSGESVMWSALPVFRDRCHKRRPLLCNPKRIAA